MHLKKIRRNVQKIREEVWINERGCYILIKMIFQKLLAVFLCIINPDVVYGAGGFTWMGQIAHNWYIPEHVLTFILIGVFLTLIGLVYSYKVIGVSDVIIPQEGFCFRNICELYGRFIYRQCQNIMGDEGASRHFSFIAMVFIMILFCNLIGLIPGFLPPTEHFSTTLALGVFSFVYYNIKGVKEQGFFNYIKHFAGPLWYLAVLIFPIEIVSNLIRPLSLALRLKNNMMGDHLILSEFSKLVPAFIPIVFMALGVLVSLVQAYVFTILTMVYIRLATHHDHGEDGRH